MTDAAEKIDSGREVSPYWNNARTVADAWANRNKANGADIVFGNKEAIDEYNRKLAETEAVVVDHPASKPLTEMQVAQILTARVQTLFRIKNETRQFEVDQHNQPILTALKWYLMRDVRFESEGHGSLNKGLMLAGLQGCGKTTLMRAMSDCGPQEWLHDGKLIASLGDLMKKSWGDGVCFNQWRLNDMHNAVTLEHGFRKDGEKAIDHIRKAHKPIVIDEFGFENDKVLNYGNKVNLMAEMINSRYIVYQETGILTHMTTNLVNGDDIESMYGVRIRSRIREMFNVLVFDTDNHVDRRK